MEKASSWRCSNENRPLHVFPATLATTLPARKRKTARTRPSTPSPTRSKATETFGEFGEFGITRDMTDLWEPLTEALCAAEAPKSLAAARELFEATVKRIRRAEAEAPRAAGLRQPHAPLG